MGLDGLVVAGSHGFDIWSPPTARSGATRAPSSTALLAQVTSELESGAGEIEGALVEPKAASVALHYRLVAEADSGRVVWLVDQVLADHPGELKVTPGKMVYRGAAGVRLGQGQGRALPARGTAPG